MAQSRITAQGPPAAAAKKKTPRRGSATTATTNKSSKTNKTKKSNVSNKTANSKATNNTKSSSISRNSNSNKTNSNGVPPRYSHAPTVPANSSRPAIPKAPTGQSSTPAARNSQNSAPVQSRQATSTALVPKDKKTSNVLPGLPRRSPGFPTSSQASHTGQRVGMDGRTSPPNQHQNGRTPPKPPSFLKAGTTGNGNSKLSAHRGTAMMAPARPLALITDGSNVPNRQPTNQPPLPSKTKGTMSRSNSGNTNQSRSKPKTKSKSLPIKTIPNSTALVPRLPDSHISARPTQPHRTVSLQPDDLAVTESDGNGGSRNASSSSNPFRGIFARTRSMMEDLMGSGDCFVDEPTTAIVPYNDSNRRAMARKGSTRQSRRFSNQSDHQSIGASSYHRNHSLPPPPNTGSFVPGLGGGSLHGGSSHSVDFLSSGSTVLSRSIMEEPPFENDPAWKTALRYLRVLPPSPKELPMNRKIRIYIWLSLILDLICAVVAIATFTQVTTCCGKPIWSLGGSADWSLAMKVISYIYIFGIVLEVVPVVRESGIPWNMMNPLFGFMLTFAVFFDDSRAEAISMWILETTAVVLDFLVYRLKRQKRADKKDLLDTINQRLEPFFASNRRANAANGTPMDISFHDTAISAMEEETVADHKEIKLLRDRRNLRLSLAEDQKHLNYHLAGVAFNSVLIFITLIFIVAIATTGGMCVHDNNTPNPFSRNPLGLCSSCQGTEGTCEICTATTQQCYYPY